MRYLLGCLGWCVLALFCAGCAREPSVLDPKPSPEWFEAEHRKLPTPSALPNSATLVAASGSPAALAWIERRDDTVEVWIEPNEPEGAQRKLVSRPVGEGYFKLSLSPDGKHVLLLRQDPRVQEPLSQAVLELWDLGHGGHQEVSDTAAFGFDPTWTANDRFLFAEVTAGFMRVLEQELDGSRVQALAHEAPYPHLLISPLAPHGWIVYDRSRPQETHAWVRTTTEQGPPWSEVGISNHQFRLLGWWQDRPVVALSRRPDETACLLLAPSGLDLAGNRFHLDGSQQLAVWKGIDSILMQAHKIAFLEDDVTGHRLGLFDLESKSSVTLALPSRPAKGRRLYSAGPSQATLLVEGPLLSPSLALIDFLAPSLDLRKNYPISGLDVRKVKVDVDPGGVTLTPPQGDLAAPVLVEAYGGFGVDLSLGFDEVWLDWLRRGGRVRLEQIEGRPKAQERTLQELMRRVDALGEIPIVLRGRSMGGTLALMAVLAHPERFAAVYADAAVTDLLHFSLIRPGELWKPEFGDPDRPEERPRLRALSPLHSIRRQRYPAVLMSASPSDRVVDARYTTRFLQRLQQLSPTTTTALLWTAQGAHGPFRPATGELQAAVEFLWGNASLTQPEKPTR